MIGLLAFACDLLDKSDDAGRNEIILHIIPILRVYSYYHNNCCRLLAVQGITPCTRIELYAVPGS